MQSSFLLSVMLISAFLVGASPGDKRLLLTSGEQVHTIHYQLGQSTVLYFGMRPDTVICGNKNYFNIEKIKEGLTIQPLASFSTNLTILTQGKRFLFYLTPAKGGKVDTFIDVRWIPETESRVIAKVDANSKEAVRELSQKMSLSTLDVQLKRQIQIVSAKRTILEFEVKNTSQNVVMTSDIEALILKGSRPVDHQASVFEQDELKSGKTTTGRLIVTGPSLNGATFVMNYLGKGTKVQLTGGSH